MAGTHGLVLLMFVWHPLAKGWIRPCFNIDLYLHFCHYAGKFFPSRYNLMLSSQLLTIGHSISVQVNAIFQVTLTQGLSSVSQREIEAFPERCFNSKGLHSLSLWLFLTVARPVSNLSCLIIGS